MRIGFLTLFSFCSSITAFSQDTVSYQILARLDKQYYYLAQPFSGIALKYYDGKKQQKRHLWTFKNGIKDGLTISWYNNGIKGSEGYYKEDRMDGSWVYYTWQGNKKELITYKMGVKHGAYNSWYKYGKKMTEERKSTDGFYIDGKKHGQFIYYYQLGEKHRVLNYIAGKMAGKNTTWNKEGTILSETIYKDNKGNGQFVEYYDNGELKTQGNYKEGKKDGLWTAWYPYGDKKKETNYDKGQIQSFKSYAALTFERKKDTAKFEFPEFTLLMMKKGLYYYDRTDMTKDTFKVELGLGTDLQKIKLIIKPFECHNIKITECYEKSISISGEGPHLDLLNWIHQYSEWRELSAIAPYEYLTSSDKELNWKQKPEYTKSELIQVVDSLGGERWLTNLEMGLNSGFSMWGLSRIYLKISGETKNHKQFQKVLIFLVPMGC